MLTYVFVGPTIAPEDARSELDAVYLPPARCGDFYAATLRKPWAIALIDGYFEQERSVWHKEILWAMANGVHVFGASSMGALRAAELEPFGMEGFGKIFSDFRSGVLEDDDEVAIKHGPPEVGYCALTDPLVNIRSTLRAAAAAAVLSDATAELLAQKGKELHYSDRTFARMLKEAEGSVARSDLRRFEIWLAGNVVDQKKADAIELLQAIQLRSLDGASPKRVNFLFKHTEAWEQFCRHNRRA